MPDIPLLPLIAAVLALNGWTFAAFGIDKNLARAGRRRISESSLLGLALIGGTPGAYAGRAVFRHKTRKQPFSSQLFQIALFHMVAAGGGIGWWLGG
jgi:uncharacterized membrane protein YsdA (DUF1294 family)